MKRKTSVLGRWLKVFALLVGLGTLAFAVLVLVIRDELVEVPNVHAAFYAKETCSCLYVIGQNADYCKVYGLQMFLPSEVRFDDAARTVEARTFWGRKQTARFLGPPYGCRLDPWPEGA